MTKDQDWAAWHEPYADKSSPLSRRLRIIQGHIRSWLDGREGQTATIVSACAGQGRDLLDVLAARSNTKLVRATLLEYDERNVAIAQTFVETAAIPNVVIRQADAGEPASYVGLVPADLLLMAGVFGNISDDDVQRTIVRMPQLCAPNATVIWTRTRRGPDLTPSIRRWFEKAGFIEQAFHAPTDVLFTVGVHTFVGASQPLSARGRLFRFLD